VFSRAKIKIEYTKFGQNKGFKHENEVVGKTLYIIGDDMVEEDTKYNSFVVDCEQPIYNEGVANNISNVDAIADGSMSGLTVLIGKFYNGSEFPNSQFHSYAGAALEKKGFKLQLVNTETEFIEQLPNYDIAWIISNLERNSMGPQFADACIAHHKKGKGLFVWGDNAPYFAQANAVLPKLTNSTMQLVDNTPGDKVLKLSYDSQRGTFLPTHIITTGIPQLYEGVTICYPNTVPANVTVLAQSTDGHPVILFVDKAHSCGRVVIDCGFTKLFCKWDSIGTARYVSNAAGWLAGFEVTKQFYFE